jgi:hypothetical protein
VSDAIQDWHNERAAKPPELTEEEWAKILEYYKALRSENGRKK